MGIEGEDCHLQAKERVSEETNPADTLILDFQPPGWRENKFLLCKLPSLWYFPKAAPANGLLLMGLYADHPSQHLSELLSTFRTALILVD